MILAALARGTLKLFDFLADRACLFFAVPCAGHLYLFAQFVLSAQGLAQAAFVVSDEVGCSRKNMPCAAIIPLQADDLRAGKIVIKAQDVIDLSAAPAVDRLIIVADAADVFGNAEEVCALLFHLGECWKRDTGFRGLGSSVNLPVRRLIASRNDRHRARRSRSPQVQPT